MADVRQPDAFRMKRCDLIIDAAAEPSVDKIRRGDVPFYVTDTRKVEKQFDWAPRRSVTQTVQDTAQWVQDNRKILARILHEEP